MVAMLPKTCSKKAVQHGKTVPTAVSKATDYVVTQIRTIAFHSRAEGIPVHPEAKRRSMLGCCMALLEADVPPGVWEAAEAAIGDQGAACHVQHDVMA